MTTPQQIPVDRTEEWRRTRVEEGRPVNETAVVDICVGNYVVVSYEVLATLLGALGFARIDNLFDKEYVGSVYINEGSQRYYAPAAERTWLIGLSASYSM